MSFFKQINQQIQDARHTAKLEAKEYGFPVLRSRGVEMNGYKRVNGSEISTNNEPWEIGSRGMERRHRDLSGRIPRDRQHLG